MTMMTFLPPISRWTFLKVGAARSETMRPTSVEPVNDTTRTSGARGHRVADLVAAARHEVDDARRDAGFLEDLTKFTADSGVSVAGLKTTVLPQTSAGIDLPGGNRHREVPRRDHGADAERLADRHRELVAQLGGNGLAVLAPPFARHEERHVDRFLHVAARLREHLAHLARHVARQRLLALGEAAAPP